MRVRRTGHRTYNERVPSRIVWDYRPTDRQEVFHRGGARYKLYGGAVGGGKSWALCAEAVKLSLKFPGNRGFLCRHQLVDFKRSTLVTFDSVCPAALIRKHFRDDRIILFRNGSEILYGGLGGDEDLERIKSTEFGWFGIEEATETYEDMFLLLCSRLRWKLPSGAHPRYVGLLTSNPEPGWVKDRFIDRNLPDHVFVPALPKDNPHLPEGYDSNLRVLYPEEWVKRYLDGSWDVFEGQIYTEFDRAKHVYDSVEIGKYWERFRVIDHGYTNPTCCLYVAIDHDGCMWIDDEHYEKSLTIRENATIIRNKHPEYDSELTLMDPSCFSSTMQHQGKVVSVADEYRDYGIVAISPYDRDGWKAEGIGINLVKQRLKENKLRINKRCENTISEILKYRWRDLSSSQMTGRNAPEQPVDKDNHACDNLRYACCWKPSDATRPRAQADPGTLHYAILQHKKQLQTPFFAGWS